MKYDAFISYRHSDLDMDVAKRIHKKLETFKVPRSVTEKSGKKSIKRVFRDQEELPIGSDLGDNIKQALSESEYLIVVCSPRTPESYWVQKEIDTFIEMHGRGHILAVLVEGEPDEAFPKQLLSDDNGNPVEPLAADVRGISKKDINKKMRTEIVRLAAPLLNCSYDDLRQRHRERQLKKAFCVSSLAAVFAIAFGCYSAYNYIAIQKNYKGKLINQSKYLADTAVSLLEDGDRVTAGLIALEALPDKNNNRPYVASAQYALSETLNIYKNGNKLEKDCLLKHDFPVRDISFNNEGTKLVTIDNGGNVYVWDVINGTLITKVVPETDSIGIVSEPLGAMVTKDNNLIIVKDNSIYSIDFKGNEIWSISDDKDYSYCKYDLETEIAAWISYDKVSFIDMTDGSSKGDMKISSDKYIFTEQGVFSEDHNKFSIGCIPEDDTAANGIINIYDFKTSVKSEYITKGSFIAEHRFTSEGDIIVLSEDLEKIRDYTSSKLDGYIEKIDFSSKNTVWTNTVKMKLFESDAAASNLKCRNYADESTGDIHDEVLLSVDNMVYVWDAVNGNQVSEIGVTSGITDILISMDSGLGYIIESNGVMDFFNLTEGKSYNDYSIDIGKSVKEVLIQNEILAASAGYSPDVILMKYHEGYGMEEIASLTKPAVKMDYSSDESFYVLKSNDDSANVYYFYKTEDGSLTDEWSPEKNDEILCSRFISKTDYALIDNNGNIILYNAKTKEEKEIEPEEDMEECEVCFSQNNNYAFVYSTDTYYVADLKNQKITAYGNIEEPIYGGVISDDGRFYYGSIVNTDVVCIDTETGEYSKIDLDGYNVSVSSDENSVFAISSNGKLLAVRCLDNKLRVLDIKNKKTIDEVEFVSRKQCFISFCADDSKLIMQGDSYYFRVYDIKKHEFIYIAKNQNNTINDIIYDNDSNLICILTASEMLILNETDYELLAFIEDGLSYMPKHSYVFNKYDNQVYRFPYMNLDMLIKEAERQFKDAKLTKRERTQYNVD